MQEQVTWARKALGTGGVFRPWWPLRAQSQQNNVQPGLGEPWLGDDCPREGRGEATSQEEQALDH